MSDYYCPRCWGYGFVMGEDSYVECPEPECPAVRCRKSLEVRCRKSLDFDIRLPEIRQVSAWDAFLEGFSSIWNWFPRSRNRD